MNQSPIPNEDREQFEADLRTLLPTGTIDPASLWQQHEQAHANHPHPPTVRTVVPQPAHGRMKRLAAHAITASISTAATLLLTTMLPIEQHPPNRASANRSPANATAASQTHTPAPTQADQELLTSTGGPATVGTDQEPATSLDTWLNLTQRLSAQRLSAQHASYPLAPSPTATQSKVTNNASTGGPTQTPSTWRQLALELRSEIIDPAL